MSKEQTIQQAANKHYGYRFDDEMRQLLAIVDSGESGTVDGEEMGFDGALERLQEMPLSFQKLTTHHVREEIEWEILLGTGGPADRILVRTDFRGIIESAEYQFQDWFQPWTTAEDQDVELVQRFAEIVGYYEDTER